MPQKKRQLNNKSQPEVFVQTARALECDESEEVFDKALKKIGGRQPAPPPKKRKRSA